MGWYVDLLKKMGHGEYFAKVGKTLFPPLDRVLYKATGGAILASGPPVLPTLLLTTATIRPETRTRSTNYSSVLPSRRDGGALGK